jgi:glycosyltransferase involved in cell wall biosynthesis
MKISVVIPCYNEAENIDALHGRLAEVLARTEYDYELLFVNDGSSDETLTAIQRLQSLDPSVVYIDLSRNFGKEIALTAGLDHSTGDAVIVIDADLQDPPELMLTMIARWEEGYDVVYAKRQSRQGESIAKKITAYLFYRFVNKLSDVSIPADTGDFRLLSRRAVDALVKLREHHRFMKGLFTWIGYRQIAVPFHRQERYAGKTKWNYWKLWNFAIEGITSFSNLPLKLSSYIGAVVALGAFVYGLFIVLKTLVWGEPVMGYPSMITVILFLGGVQLFVLGVIGEYLGRMFNESKARPLYFVNEVSRQNEPINNFSGLPNQPFSLGNKKSTVGEVIT